MCARGGGRKPAPGPATARVGRAAGTAGSRAPPHTWAELPPPAGPGLRRRGGAAKARCGGVAERIGAPAIGAPAGARRPGDGLAYLCLFPDHIVGAEQVSQEQVELLLLRRGRRHCARREREKEGGETGAVRRAGGPAGGAGGGPSAGTGTSCARGTSWAGRERAEQRRQGRMGRGLATPHPAAAAGVGASLALGARGGAEAASSGAAPIGHAPCGAVTGGAWRAAGLGVGQAGRDLATSLGPRRRRGGGGRSHWRAWPRRGARGRAGEEGPAPSAGDFGAAGRPARSPQPQEHPQLLRSQTPTPWGESSFETRFPLNCTSTLPRPSICQTLLAAPRRRAPRDSRPGAGPEEGLLSAGLPPGLGRPPPSRPARVAHPPPLPPPQEPDYFLQFRVPGSCSLVASS